MLIRLTLDIQDDEIIDCIVETTKGCPQCDAGASHDDLPDHPDGGVGEGFAGEVVHLVRPTNSTRSDRAEADSDSRF